jgi:hypothetical protein
MSAAVKKGPQSKRGRPGGKFLISNATKLRRTAGVHTEHTPPHSGEGVYNSDSLGAKVSAHGAAKPGGRGVSTADTLNTAEGMRKSSQGVTSDMTPQGSDSAGSLPSVLTISRAIHVLWAQHGRLDEAELAARLKEDFVREYDASHGKEAILSRIYGLEALAMTQAAVTVVDAAVQVAMAYDIAEDFENCDYERAAHRAKNRDLKRLLASALPFIIEVAKLNKADIGEWAFGARAREFQDLEAGA